MTNYTIEEFWIRRLGKTTPQSGANLVDGWLFQERGLDTFREAPLTLSDGFGLSDDPDSSSLLLVSAPGAVGKTTLARQIASSTGSVYIDLAEAAPVGANTLIGGIVNSGLYQEWQNGAVAVLIDGLDEARLKVTVEAFEAFLSDVARQSASRNMPTVLFGRTGAIIHAWVVLTDHLENIPVLEIGYYGVEESIDFAEACLRASEADDRYQTVEREAIDLLLQQLRSQTESEGDRFAGYAPVLQAVAKQVELESDPQALISRIINGTQTVTLQSIAMALLDREQNKLSSLQFEDSTLLEKLYSPKEQIDRLVAYVYKSSQPKLIPMSASDEQTYTTALETWVAEHPFLDGGYGFSSAVFGAMIVNRALRVAAASEMALHRELTSGDAANPFLFAFYTGSDDSFIQPDHVGVIYASLRANLSLGDIVSLSIIGSEEIEGEEDLTADVDIVLTRQGEERSREFQFETSPDGTIRFGSHIEDLDITLPLSRVEIGTGTEAVLVAPINIQCDVLSVSSNRVIFEGPAKQNEDYNKIYLEANSLDSSSIPSSVQVRRGDVEVAAFWPNVLDYPWTRFATEPLPTMDRRIDEALRRLRQFVIAFRSHGRGRLARSARKIESTRMIKGTGRFVLQLLKDEGIISLENQRYFLDPVRLANVTGTTYADCTARHFQEKAIDFVQRSLETNAQ